MNKRKSYLINGLDGASTKTITNLTTEVGSIRRQAQQQIDLLRFAVAEATLKILIVTTKI